MGMAFEEFACIFVQFFIYSGDTFQEMIALPSHIQISVCKLNKGLLFYLVIPGAHVLPKIILD